MKNGRVTLTILMLAILSLASPVAVAGGLGDNPEKGDDPLLPPTPGTPVPEPEASPARKLVHEVLGEVPLTGLPNPGSDDGDDGSGDDEGGRDGDGGMNTPQPGHGLPGPDCVVNTCPSDDPAPGDEPQDDAPEEPTADESPVVHTVRREADGANDAVDATVDAARALAGNLVNDAGSTADTLQSTARDLLTDTVQVATFVYEQSRIVTERQVATITGFADAFAQYVEDLVAAVLPSSEQLNAAASGDAYATSGNDAQVVAPASSRVALGIAAVGGLGAVMVAFAAMRRLLSIGSVGLLSRIPSKDIMKNDTRAAIFDIVENDPGVSLNEIVSRLGLSRNAVAYHLAVFESEKQVVSVKDGKYRRYFLNGGKYVNGAKDVVSAIKNDVTLDVIRYIVGHPGTMQKEVCEAVGTSPSATNWHINRLQKVGLVEKEKVANTVRYTPGPSLMKYDLDEFGLAAPEQGPMPMASADAFVHA